MRSAARIFWSPCCSPGWQCYLLNPSLGSTVSSGYVLFGGTVSSLIASLGLIPVINDFVLIILLTILFKFLTQVVGTFSGSWNSWTSIGLINSFANSLLNASTKAVWVCLYFVVGLRIFRLCFSSNFITSPVNSEALSHWNVFGYLRTPPFLSIASNTNATPLCALVLKGLATLYLDATSTSVKIYLYMFPSERLWGI